MNIMTSIDAVGSDEPVEDQTSWVVCDTETTGMEKHDQVIEWANVWPEATWSTLIKPTVPIHCAARASHHITDGELKDKPTFPEWLERNGEHRPFGNARYFVAHNAEFDVQMLKQTGLSEELFPEKVICTYRCSRHLWSTAPSHKNQALRYHFDLEFTSQEKKLMRSLASHRALYDAIVTRGLLRLMLEKKTLSELEEFTRTPFLIEKIGFGKHKGTLYKDIPTPYLEWMILQGPKRILPNGESIGFTEDELYTANHYIKVAA